MKNKTYQFESIFDLVDHHNQLKLENITSDEVDIYEASVRQACFVAETLVKAEMDEEDYLFKSHYLVKPLFKSHYLVKAKKI